MEERGLSMAHTTIMRWMHQYGPELDERVRRHLKTTNDSWRVDERGVREWECPACKTFHDRDINAGLNLRNEAVRLLTVRTTGIA
jgi:transposase-like protein